LLCALIPISTHSTIAFILTPIDKIVENDLIIEQIARAFLILVGIGFFIVSFLMVAFLIILLKMKVKEQTESPKNQS
jgi:hypothetical protein